MQKCTGNVNFDRKPTSSCSMEKPVLPMQILNQPKITTLGYFAGIDLSQADIEGIKQTLLSDCSKVEGEQPGSQASSTSGSEPEDSSNTEAGKDPGGIGDESEQKADRKRMAGLDALLKARRSLQASVAELTSQDFDISFNGVETGDIEAVIRARWKHDDVCQFLAFQPRKCAEGNFSAVLLVNRLT